MATGNCCQVNRRIAHKALPPSGFPTAFLCLERGDKIEITPVLNVAYIWPNLHLNLFKLCFMHDGGEASRKESQHERFLLEACSCSAEGQTTVNLSKWAPIYARVFDSQRVPPYIQRIAKICRSLISLHPIQINHNEQTFSFYCLSALRQKIGDRRRVCQGLHQVAFIF